MITKTGKGTTIYLAFNKDCGYNKGGYYVEIFLGDNCYFDCYDYFCIHTDDCDCSNMEEVEKFAENYVKTITEY